MVPLVQASPRADCPHRRPPYLHMQLAQHPMRPCLQTPQSLPTSMTLALLCLQGATGGGCLKRVKPKSGSPLLGFSFSGATNPGQGMSHRVCRTWLPPSEPPASTCICRHPPYTCPRASAPLPSSTHKHDIFDCAFSSMHVRQRQGTRHVYSYSRVGFDEASHCSYTIIAGKLVVLLLVGF